MKTFQSWGRVFKRKHEVLPVSWRNESFSVLPAQKLVLPYGNGRSYGDVCLNDQGVLLDTAQLNHFIEFDEESGALTVESGALLGDILDVIISKNWFLPVTPGTQWVTVGGAVANDVHGKNHHGAGTFGCHVIAFELMRSNGEKLICSKSQNAELFRATIGGLGLTGLILWVQIQLTKIPGPWIEVESIRFRNLDEFMLLSKDSDAAFPYTVAWVDSLAQGTEMGRGIFMRGNFVHENPLVCQRSTAMKINIPFEAPSFLLSPKLIQLFNQMYYHRQEETIERKTVFYEPFFYPLDAIQNWNRLYGKNGFFQYQCVIPDSVSHEGIREVFEKITRSRKGAFLAVLKSFGSVTSPGILSFPRPGITLALDFQNRGEETLELLNLLDETTMKYGGAINPSKDARMSSEVFRMSFPRWKEFVQWKDPKFSSDFWRRLELPERIHNE